EETFKNKLSEHLKEDMKESSNWYFRNEAQKLMLEKHEMTFPDEFLKRWLLESELNRNNNEKNQALPRPEEEIKEQIEKEFPEFLKSLKWSLIVEKINKDNSETTVEPEELREGIKSYLSERYGKMEGQTITDQQLEEFLNYTLQNEELVRMHYKRMADEKLFDYLTKQIEGEAKTISATDFTELIKPKEGEE
ncbi:MAG: hypothetical protein KDE26_07205, partial [Bacteroidetes bacterium]|nr:hypothetical protein [Bacteroidota bacterium]